MPWSWIMPRHLATNDAASAASGSSRQGGLRRELARRARLVEPHEVGALGAEHVVERQRGRDLPREPDRHDAVLHLELLRPGLVDGVAERDRDVRRAVAIRILYERPMIGL